MSAVARALRLPRFSRQALAVLLRHWLAWRKTYRTSMLLNFGEPVMSLVALGWGLGAYITRMNDMTFLQFIAPGLMAVTAMNAVVFDTAFGGYFRLRERGVYEAAASTSLTAEELVAGDILWEALRSILYGLVFLTVLLAFGLVQSFWVILLPAVLLVNGMLFASLTLVVVTRAGALDQLFYYFTLFITPMFLFSGVFFPVERLPESLQVVVRALPLYHTVEIMRDLVLGAVGTETLRHFGRLGLTALLAMLLPVSEMRRALSK